MSSDRGEIRDQGRKIANDKGKWTVDTRSTSFGEVLNHGLDDSVLFMGLPQHHGWRPFGGGVKLSHQTYKKIALEWIAQHPFAREVAVVCVDTGEWKTVWVRNGQEPHADRRGEPVFESEGDDGD